MDDDPCAARGAAVARAAREEEVDERRGAAGGEEFEKALRVGQGGARRGREALVDDELRQDLQDAREVAAVDNRVVEEVGDDAEGCAEGYQAGPLGRGGGGRCCEAH